MKIITQAPSQSIFTSLSKEVKDTLYIYVFPDSKEKTYLTFVYTPSHVSGSKIGYKSRRGVISVKVLPRGLRAGTYIVALKEKCEFVELIERYDITLSLPYSISNGKRSLCVYGEVENLERCVDNLRAYYGAKNVHAEKIPLIYCLEQQARSIINAYILSYLTEREREFLLKACTVGYMSQRRRAKLSDLAGNLNVSKPTASLMIRKAIEKIVKRLLEVQ